MGRHNKNRVQQAALFWHRRALLQQSLYGMGGLGLRSLASGIPLSALLQPGQINAATMTCPSRDKAQYLILCSNDAGDPLGCNVPGTYEDPGVAHPPALEMAPKPLMVGGRPTVAAAPWANLPQSVLDRTVFFHHATYTAGHGDQADVLALNGAMGSKQNMLASAYGAELASCLGTIQQAPITLDGTTLNFQGRSLANVSPQALASVLLMPESPLRDLQSLRDETVDAMYKLYKQQGVPAQQEAIDRWVRSKAEARQVSDDLLGSLAAIKDNSASAQLLTAIILFKMNITPVVGVRLAFGGDNHGDGNLANEAAEYVKGIAALAELFTNLKSMAPELQDKVTFATMTVFGRTMALANRGLSGRDHNDKHNVAVMIGAHLRGGIVGGITPIEKEYKASAINSTTGEAASGGDIPFEETFGAMGKTLGLALGLEKDYVDRTVRLGKPVLSALM